ncbi:GDP-L-fucose synthase family protein [Methylomicrobium lacus]|uniref:GDP-L-fucose synthase family protein n=1 Tax=Methylomicrobium lacus TaxID=136992 RepID=UPI0035A8FE47
MDKNAKIYVAGHQGMVGSAICRQLNRHGFYNVVTRSRSELNLLDQNAVCSFMQQEKPEYVFLAAAKVGGIYANNQFPAEFIHQNLLIEAHVIHQAYQAGCSRLLFLGSSCIYPKHAEQPMRESALLTGVLEATNEPYAIAKIAGIKLCESYNRQYGTDFRSVMPTNLYGPHDNFHEKNSHVIPALLRRFHFAKLNAQPSIEVWGTGQAKREFLYVEDMAVACLHVMQLDPELYRRHTQPMLSHINIGTGKEVSIAELVNKVAEVTRYQGQIVWNLDMPDGTPRKLLDVSRLRALGWAYDTELSEGLDLTYRWFVENQGKFRE